MDQMTPNDISARLKELQVGENQDLLHLELKQQHQLAAATMAKQAHHSIHLYSHDLDSAVYSNREFVSGVARLAASSRHAKIQILVKDTNPIIQHGHMLLETARKLSTYITIKKVDPEFHSFAEAFFIVDERALIRRPVATRYEGQACFDAPREARELIRFFNEVWHKSRPEAKLRRLHI